ncbi:MAG TPA: hypothetical protein VLV85_01120 [Stellaceae bacterium]|nr:hypothetical protein [Stellaceae bacterium]
MTRQRVLLGGGEHGRNHHRAGMHRAALEGVVVIFAMSGGAVAERGGGNVEPAGMTDRRAGSGFAARAERRSDIVGIARRNAEAGDIDEKSIADAGDARRKPLRPPGERRGQLLRYGDFRQCHDQAYPR